MSGTGSLCAFCGTIPLDVDTLERLRPKSRFKSRGRGPRTLPLDVGGETQLVPEAKAVFVLGKLDRVLSSICPFCKIIATAVRDIKRIIGWESLQDDTLLSLRWSHDGPGSQGVFTLNNKHDVYICFVAERGMNPGNPWAEKLMQSSMCVINPKAIHLEPSEVVRWIVDCQETHGTKCNADVSTTGPIKDCYRGLHLMRFVDVHQKCIVERTDVARYVALSYVWGAAATFRLTRMNQPQMSRPGALRGVKVPATILDAIDLTRACGEDYLWVDSLCIMQNDVEDLEAGTRVMDLIYERSVFTIVAASGHDAGYGLPGISRGLRVAQPYTEVSSGVHLGIMSELDILISSSCYATRGWTMQEEILSKRVLYFVDDKIFFHCPYKTVFEGCSGPLWLPAGSLLSMERPFQNYKALIEAYSKRVLTKDDDAFLAISGILSRISGTQKWQIIAGLPTIALEDMMLFQRRHHMLCRRRAFPSYSWLGWNGALEFIKGVDILGGWIVWYVWYPASDTLLIDYRPACREASTKMMERLTSQVEANFGLLPNMDIGQQVPSKRDLGRLPRPFPLLRFWTLAVFFALSDVDYVKGAATLESRHDRAGRATLDGLDDCPLSHPGEFILLSWISLDSGGCKMYQYIAMLIDWVDGVAERRGIGYIDSSAIQNSLAPGPIWKEIVLG